MGRFTEEDYKQWRLLRGRGFTYTEIASIYKTGSSYVNRILRPISPEVMERKRLYFKKYYNSEVYKTNRRCREIQKQIKYHKITLKKLNDELERLSNSPQ